MCNAIYFSPSLVFFLILADDLVGIETLLLFEVLPDGGGFQFVEAPIALTVALAALTFDPCALEAFKAAIFFYKQTNLIKQTFITVELQMI